MNRIICFDIETTGFDYAKGDRILEVGAVEIIDGKITGKTFHSYVNPEGKIIPHSSYMVHKLSNEFLEDKPLFKDVAPRLLEFFGDSPIVAHNGMDFDFPFINFELRKLYLSEIIRDKQIDSIILARRKVFGPKDYTLDSLAKWFGVSLTARADAHGALIDSEILAKVYLEIEGAAAGKTTAEIIDEQRAAMAAHPKIGVNFARRSFATSADEVKLHEKFVSDNIKNAIWENK